MVTKPTGKVGASRAIPSSANWQYNQAGQKYNQAGVQYGGGARGSDPPPRLNSIK